MERLDEIIRLLGFLVEGTPPAVGVEPCPPAPPEAVEEPAPEAGAEPAPIPVPAPVPAVTPPTPAQPSVAFASPSSSGSELSSPVLLLVALSVPSSQSVAVNYASLGGTATGGGVDYTLSAGTLIFNPGETTKNVSITIVSDTISESNETIEVTLSNALGATLSTPAIHTYTILDDDPPEVSITALDATAGEGGNLGQFRVTRAGGTSVDLTVFYSVSGTATNGLDYRLLPGAVAISVGANTATITVTPIEDTLDETDETVTVTLNPSGAYIVDINDSATVTIQDNDSSVAFAAASSSGPESSTPVSLVLVLSKSSSRTVTVSYSVTGGTATPGADYTLAVGTLTFNPGETSKSISMTIVNDFVPEGAETIEVTLTGATNATLGATRVHTYTILDDDP